MMQTELFARPRQDITENDLDLIYIPHFLSTDRAARLFDELYANSPWQQRDITLFENTYPEPRLTAWYGLENYSYTGLKQEQNPWTDTLNELRIELQGICRATFTGVLLNLYRNGQDGVGWHADDETEIRKNSCIASLSLGATRRFKLKHRYRKELAQKNFDLEAGDLVVMQGRTQQFWKHTVPKTAKVVGARINLTFRNIIGAG
jgi:alkylated DNA repair dioxygenase AlkB